MDINEVVALKSNLESNRERIPYDELPMFEKTIGECQRVIDGSASSNDIDGVQFMLMQMEDRKFT